jgi:membrane protease YdiL (CAAX protease family)
MKYKSVKGFTGWGQLAVIIGFSGVGLIVAGLVQMYLGNKALGPNNLPLQEKGEAMIKALMRPENVKYAQLSQILGTFFLFFIPSVAYILICHKRFFWAGFSRHFSLAQVVVGFFIILVGSAFANPFADISKAIFAHFPHWDAVARNADKVYNEAIAAMSSLHTWPQFIVAVFIIAFLPALFEELIFRGVLQNLLVRWWKKPLLAIIITSLLFSLIHASYYLFISRFVLGFILGLLFYQSKNIWVNTFAHFMNNLLAVAQLFYLNKTKNLPVNVNDMDAKLPIWSLLVSFAILYGLFILFKKISTANKLQIETKETSLMAQVNPFGIIE